MMTTTNGQKSSGNGHPGVRKLEEFLGLFSVMIPAGIQSPPDPCEELEFKLRREKLLAAEAKVS